MSNKKRWFLKDLKQNGILDNVGYTSLKEFEEIVKLQCVKKRDNYKLSFFPEYDASDDEFAFQLVDKDGNPPKRAYKPPVEPLDPSVELEQLKKDHMKMKNVLLDISYRYNCVVGVNDSQKEYLESIGVEFEDDGEEYVQETTKKLEEIGNRKKIHPPVPPPPKFVKGGCLIVLASPLALFSYACYQFISS